MANTIKVTIRPRLDQVQLDCDNTWAQCEIIDRAQHVVPTASTV